MSSRRYQPPEDRADRLINEVASATALLHFGAFVFGAIFCAVLFGAWQISQLQQPWYSGPWHIIYFGWLSIYFLYAQYAVKRAALWRAASEATEGQLPDQDRVTWWFERVRPPAQPEWLWWLRIPLSILICLLWPLLLAAALMFGLFRVVMTPAKWPEAGACMAAILALMLVPTYGPGPLLVMALHVAIVVWLRSA